MIFFKFPLSKNIILDGCTALHPMNNLLPIDQSIPDHWTFILDIIGIILYIIHYTMR